MWPYLYKRFFNVEYPKAPASEERNAPTPENQGWTGWGNWGNTSLSGVSVTRDTALGVPAIWDAVNKISTTLASQMAGTPNAVLPQWLPDQPSEYKGRAAWIGSAGLQYDLNSTHAQKWFEEWQEQYRQWLFFGYRPEIASGPNCTGVPYGFVYEFFESIVNAGLNVVWKPLRDLPFNQSKSNIAWLTATMAGAVCVTNFAGREGWECALPEFTTDENEIYAAFHRSRNVILQDYNLLTVNERRLESIKSLLTGKKTTA